MEDEKEEVSGTGEANEGASGVLPEQNPLELGITMTSEAISTDENPLPKASHPNDVKFKVKYKGNFEGEKTMPEGSVQVVSKESAEHFAKLGIGSVIK